MTAEEWHKRNRKTTLYLMRSGEVTSVEESLRTSNKSRSSVYDYLKEFAVDTRKVNTDAAMLCLESKDWCAEWFSHWKNQCDKMATKSNPNSQETTYDK